MSYARKAISLVFMFLPCLTFSVAMSATTLRMSLPPVYESLPIAFAEEWGLFDEHGIDVELFGFTTNYERSLAFAADQLDAVIEDLTQALIEVNSGLNVIITSAAAICPQTGSSRTALVCSASLPVDSAQALFASGFLIGTEYQSNHEYLVDRLAEAVNFTGSIRYSFFDGTLDLAVFFAAGALAAVMPEPYSTYISTYDPPSGDPIDIVTLSDFADIEIPPQVVTFHQSYIDENPEVVAAFYEAYAEAVYRLNATPREELFETGLDVVFQLFFQSGDSSTIGDDVLDAIPIPVFLAPQTVSETAFSEVMTWLDEKRYVWTDVAYCDVMEDLYLP